MRLRGLCKLPDERDWPWEKLGPDLVGRTMFSKALIQLFADEWDCTPCWLFGLRWPSPGVYRLYGRVNGELQEGLCQREPSQPDAVSAPIPVVSTCWPTPPQETFQHEQVVLVQLPFLWILVHTRFCVCPPRLNLCSLQSRGCPVIKSCWPARLDSLGSPSSFVRSSSWEAWCVVQSLHESGISLVLFFFSLWVTHQEGMGFDFILF